jgi:predicted regulator of Ras-like GTPase activity (Roadblock/LC7/MglB family)
LVVVADEKLTGVEREFLRLQGTAHIIEMPVKDIDVAQLGVLSRSNTWISAPLQRMPLPDVMQMMATHRQSGMISVVCPHCSLLSRMAWNDNGPFGCVSGGDECAGFQGRVYIHEGNVSHLETPVQNGLEALSQLLRLRSGNVRVHEVFVEPAEGNASGTVQNYLMNAVVALDEADNEGEPDIEFAVDEPESGSGARVPPPPPTSKHDSGGMGESSDNVWASSVSSSGSITSGEKQEMPAIDKVLRASSELKVVAKADSSGNVAEVSGEGDGESMCAVAALCVKPMERALEILGLGAPESWSIVTEKVALYVRQRDDGFLVAQGKSSKSPAQTLNKVVIAGEGL